MKSITIRVTTMTSRHHGGAGFTLVELIVVMAIIALLMALLLPTLKAARQAAAAAVCMSGVRQTHLIMMTYFADFGGVIPQGASQGLVNGTWQRDYWYEFYDKGQYFSVHNDSLHCPNVEAGRYGVFRSHSTQLLSGEVKLYPYGLQSGVNTYVFYSFQLDHLAQPSTYNMAADTATRDGGTTLPLTFPVKLGGPVYHSFSRYNSGGQKHQIWLAHQGRANIAFADGHAVGADVDQLLAVGNYNPSPVLDYHGIDAWWDEDGQVVNMFP